MDHRDSEDALEAGEDGTFDLGDHSPPPSPTKSTSTVTSNLTPTREAAPVDLRPATPAEAATAHKIQDPVAAPPSTIDNASVSVDEAKEATSESLSSGLAGGEEFQDAVEVLRPDEPAEVTPEIGTEISTNNRTESTGRLPESAAPAEPTECLPGDDEGIRVAENEPLPQLPGSGAAGTGRIAAGLSNVKLPLPYKRWQTEGIVWGTEEEDSEGEGEFHDAYDSVAGIQKNAAKALEMKEAGNGHYKSGDYDEAADYYSMALEYCPDDDEHKQDRAVYLGNRAACHLQLKEFEPVVDDCTAALELNPRYVKALLRRAQANENMEKYDAALEDMKALLEIDPGLKVARESAPRLEKLHKEKMEKMKDEALGKLKELGNSLLGHFGLSTDNFKMQQDPNTGSYSINFEK